MISRSNNVICFAFSDNKFMPRWKLPKKKSFLHNKKQEGGTFCPTTLYHVFLTEHHNSVIGLDQKDVLRTQFKGCMYGCEAPMGLDTSSSFCK